jgi:kumamolisin
MAETHAEVEGSRRVPLPGAKATGRANPHATIEVSLKLRRRTELPPLNGRPSSVMTRKQLAASYGASDEDVEKVVQTFTKFGLKPLDTNSATRTVRLSGTTTAMEEAFQVKLFNYAHDSGNYRSRVGLIHVPVDVKDIVQGVFGLDNRRVAKTRGQLNRNSIQARSLSVPSAWYVPSELASHYNFPSGDGSGQTIGLLEFGGGYFSEDLKKFCKLAGVAVPKVTTVSTDWTAADSRDGAEGEVMLDIEVVAGICAKANIVVYFAQWSEQGWITALDAAMQDQKNDPGVLSVRWGNAEDTDVWTNQAMTQINETLHEAAMLGVTVCIAAGDDGSNDGVTDGHAHVDFPGSSPYVLSVGGTTIPTKGETKPDIVWKKGDGLRADGGGSTGGGASAVFARPDWQKNVTIKSRNPGAIVGRCVPDVAANADWNASPYLLVVDGKTKPNGGTSPVRSGINADRGAGKRIGYLHAGPVPKSRWGGTVGAASNTIDPVGGYSAGPGYDAASVWGTPNGVKFAAALPK